MDPGTSKRRVACGTSAEALFFVVLVVVVLLLPLVVAVDDDDICSVLPRPRPRSTSRSVTARRGGDDGALRVRVLPVQRVEGGKKGGCEKDGSLSAT